MPDDFVDSNLTQTLFDYVMLDMDTKLACHYYNTSVRVSCGVSGHPFVAKCEEKYGTGTIQEHFNISEIRKNWFSEVHQVCNGPIFQIDIIKIL